MANSAAFQNIFFSLQGRLSRTDFWIFSALALVVSSISGGVYFFLPLIVALLIQAIFLAIFIISCSITVRRLHDMGYTGWLAVFLIIPLLNILLVLFCAFMEGTKGDNAYGPQPTASIFSKF